VVGSRDLRCATGHLHRETGVRLSNSSDYGSIVLSRNNAFQGDFRVSDEACEEKIMDTLDTMRIFARVVADGGFTAAARNLDTTTGHISRSVSHLETRLRTRLLNRTTRKLALTEAGSRYLEHCRKILSQIDLAESEASDALVSLSGTLKIHAMSSFGQHHIVPTLLRFQQKYPDVKIDLTFSQSVPDLLEKGFDASLVLAPALPNSALIAHRVGVVVGVACASPSYIAKHGAPTHPADLTQHTCLQLTNPVLPSGKWMFNSAEGVKAVPLGSSVFTVNQADALELVIRQGLGIGVLPVGAALPGLRSGELVRVLSAFDIQALNVYAVYPSRRYVDAKIRSWIDFLREDMPKVFADDVAALAALNV
jgi:DNA-binding transcriptional LysR family regulator